MASKLPEGLYVNKGSRVIWFSITLPGRGRVRESTGTDDPVEAEKTRDRRKAELWDAPAPVALKGPTWGRAVELWLKKKKRSGSELYSLTKFNQNFPDRPLPAITVDAVDAALSFCEAPSTYNRYLAMIGAILNNALDAGLLNKKIKLRKRDEGKKKARKWITREQWRALQKELPPHLERAAAFTLETGLRQSNCLGLTWDRIDLKRRHMWIEAEDMKADEALPVRLSDAAIKILQGELGKHPTHVFTYRGEPFGEPKNAWGKACTRAGLGRFVFSVDDEGKQHQEYIGFTWHGLRHTWATWHRQKNTPKDVLQQLGGWKDPRMVENYSHHTSEHLATFVSDMAPEEKPVEQRRHSVPRPVRAQQRGNLGLRLVRNQEGGQAVAQAEDQGRGLRPGRPARRHGVRNP